MPDKNIQLTSYLQVDLLFMQFWMLTQMLLLMLCYVFSFIYFYYIFIKLETCIFKTALHSKKKIL